MKLLAFMDFVHFRQTGRSVTGLDYYAWRRGPVPKTFWSELKDQKLPDIVKNLCVLGDDEIKFCEVKPKQRFDGKHFSKREIKIMEQLAYIYNETIAKDIVEISHLRNQPWDKTVKNKGYDAIIDYELAIDNQSDSLPKEEIARRLKIDHAIKKAVA